MIRQYEPDYTSSFPLQDLTEDLFLEAALKPENQSPVQACDTLYNLRGVSQALKLKVDNCWIDFLQHIGKTPADFPGINFKSRDAASIKQAREFVIQRARNWMSVNPEVTKQLIPMDSKFNTSCFTNDSMGNPELWVLNDWQNSLKCIDLTTQNCNTFKLPININPVVIHNSMKMVSAEKWMAICCWNYVQQSIAIIEKDTGALCHQIENIFNILKMHLEDKYLYVFCKNSEGQSKLLQYDSEDWKKEPAVLNIQGEFVFEFHYSRHGLLFISQAPDKRFKMLYLRNDSIFSNDAPVFIKTDPQGHFPHIKITDDGFLTFTPVEDSSAETPPVWLEKLCFENSTITKKPLQKLAVDCDKINDFEILFDKIIINHRESFTDFKCSFFDLADGKFIKEFVVGDDPDDDPFYTLKLLPNKIIQLITCGWGTSTTRIGIKNLDFKI